MNLFKSILLSFRPKTLTAALVPCLAGTALAARSPWGWDFGMLLWALVSAFLIQIGTNLVNDAADFRKGADTAERLGPQRITQAGILSARAVMLLATLAFIAAVLAGWPLVIKGGFPIVIIGIVSVVMGYAYTTGPFPLAYKGLGDLFVILFFGLIAVGGMYYLHTYNWNADACVLGLQIGLHAAVLIAINNLRDHEGDARVGKKTLAVRLGVTFSRWQIAALVLGPYVLGLYWLYQGAYLVFWFSLLSLPLGILIIRNIFQHPPSRQYNRFLGQSAGLHLSFGLLSVLGFCLL